MLVAMLGLSVAAVFLVTYSISDPAYFLPVASVTSALRIASPSLLYRRLRERFEARRSWSVIRALFGIACAVFAALSEQLAMAAGASSLMVRMALRVRPVDTLELWPVWLSATSLAIAFVLVAPYAFPGFMIAYVVSGLVGWVLGAVVVRYVD